VQCYIISIAPDGRRVRSHERHVSVGRRLASVAAASSSASGLVTAVPFAVRPLVAHGRLAHSSLQAMLPFAGVLAVAAIGQTLVIQ
jgi:ribose transport system permease protein